MSLLPDDVYSRPSLGKKLQINLLVNSMEMNGHKIIWDRQTREVRLHGLWEILGLKTIDMRAFLKKSMPSGCRRVHGGVVDIQGFWVPFRVARQLSVQCGWDVKERLLPLFGREFEQQCWPPTHPAFGSVELAQPTRFEVVPRPFDSIGHRILANKSVPKASTGNSQQEIVELVDLIRGALLLTLLNKSTEYPEQVIVNGTQFDIDWHA
ncbi:hypothetical protein BC940DRAFT_282000 [Gongronella butleri]|nr:hypothetical protein BC940DRAFT_282000 [Gongronella butleri]